MKQKAWTALLLCAGLILSLAGCGSQYGDFTTEAAFTHYAEIQVEDYGTITLALDGQAAPETVANFVALAEEGFYDGLTFHRIIETFMMQGGDPLGNGPGGSDMEI